MAAVVATTAMSGTASASQLAPLSFAGVFDTGLSPWTYGGGGAQCSNYGTPSQNPRLRGDFHFDSTIVGAGSESGRFDLPADSNSSTYPLEACDLLGAAKPIGLGTDTFSGLMVYVPNGWTIPNKAFYGVEIKEFHFQNVYGAPISYQLHADRLTLALQTGACNNHATLAPGCAYHSNADNPNGWSGNLPGYYVIPPGALKQGQWNEILMRVHWASDNTGLIRTWYKVKGQSTWTRSLNITGIPTVQWDVTRGCCYSNYVDETEAYTAALSAPLSVWMDDDITSPSKETVMASMP
jgi:hypothetical protein